MEEDQDLIQMIMNRTIEYLGKALEDFEIIFINSLVSKFVFLSKLFRNLLYLNSETICILVILNTGVLIPKL